MNDIVTTGTYIPKPFHTVHKVLRPGYKLHIGSECNDGRPITESWRYKQAKARGITIIRKPPIPGKITETIDPKQLLTTKYTPTSIKDIIGHKEQIHQIATWLQTEKKEMRGLLITGPPGIGKTTTVHLIAKELGYKVTEYNASDTRSISMLKGILALGMRRLQHEIIVMDEVDGLVGGKERGSVGEIADLIKRSPTPIICIANEKPPKLKPIVSVCQDVKFNRPMKSTIAAALLPIVKAEKIAISKVDLEQLCEKSGNDIRSILNTLEFFDDGANQTAESCKDAVHRLDLFSATQRLMSNKQMKICDAENLVYVDYHMVPLMVQEAYATAAIDIDELERAANLISEGDLMNKALWSTQDWSLLPAIVTNTVLTAKTVSGPAPFQIFPQFLGKNSKRLKQERWISALAKKMRCSKSVMRLDYAGPLRLSLLAALQQEKPDIKGLIARLDTLGLTRDDLMETLCEVCLDTPCKVSLDTPCEVSLDTVEIPTKIKTAFTREWNKGHNSELITQGKKKKKVSIDSESEMEELEEGVEELDLE